MFEDYESLLPPHWEKKKGNDGKDGYINMLTGEESDEHPFQKYLRVRNESKNQQESEENPAVSTKEEPSPDMNDSGRYSPKVQTPDAAFIRDTYAPEEQGAKTSKKSAKFPEYRCNWNERDVFGKVSLYGLTIRYMDADREDPESESKTMIKFDGLDGEWTFSALQGPSGPIDKHDLFVGAKVTVFGRHLTISTVNVEAARWIEREGKRLVTQQERFRSLIESVGQKPIVPRKQVELVRNITRGGDTTGKANLKKLLNENARLGEQISSLGITGMLGGKF